tara:strand:+ start:212 stop:604 length:393 start_codon:yes stop_codon:yes gene_type:complete
MAHYAVLDSDNIVIQVHVGKDEDDNDSLPSGCSSWEEYYGAKRTSYNTRFGVHYGEDGLPDGGVAFRKNYAVMGGTYDSVRDAFIPPQPFSSWTLDEETCVWVPPTPRPDAPCYWDEDTLSWVEDTTVIG